MSVEKNIDDLFADAEAGELFKIAHGLKAAEDDNRPWMPFWNAMDPTFVVRLPGEKCDGKTALDVLGQLGGFHLLGLDKNERLSNLEKLRVEVPKITGTHHDMERFLNVTGSGGKKMDVRLKLQDITMREIVICRRRNKKDDEATRQLVDTQPSVDLDVRQLVDWSGRKSWILLDGATELDEVVCTLRKKSDSFFLDCNEKKFRRNGNPIYKRVRMVKGDKFVVQGCEFSFESKSDFDLDQSELENAFDPLLLHRLLSIGAHEGALRRLDVHHAKWAGEAGTMLVELTRACLELNKITVAEFAGGGGHNDNNVEAPIVLDDPVRFLVRALKRLYEIGYSKVNRWMSALCAGLPLFVMDLFADQEHLEFLRKICEEFRLADVPKDQCAAAVTCASKGDASIRFDGVRELTLQYSKHELNRKELGGVSHSVSNSDPAFVQQTPDGQWWLWAGQTEVRVIGNVRKCSGWTPLYHGCRLKIGHHVALFSDARHAHMELASMNMEDEKRWTSVLHDALALGSDCASIRKNEPEAKELQKAIIGDFPAEEKPCAWSLVKLLALQPTNSKMLIEERKFVPQKINVPQKIKQPLGVDNESESIWRLLFLSEEDAVKCCKMRDGKMFEVHLFENASESESRSLLGFHLRKEELTKLVRGSGVEIKSNYVTGVLGTPKLEKMFLVEFKTPPGSKTKEVCKDLPGVYHLIEQGKAWFGSRNQPHGLPQPQDEKKTATADIPSMMPDSTCATDEKKTATSLIPAMMPDSTLATDAEKTAFSNQPECWLVIVLNMFRNFCDHWSEKEKRNTPEIVTQRRGIYRFFLIWLSWEPKFAKKMFNLYKYDDAKNKK